MITDEQRRQADDYAYLNHTYTLGKTEGMVEGEAIGIAKGEAIGITKGEAIGITKGITEGMRNIVTTMFQRGLSINEIADYTGLTPTEIRALVK